MKRISILLSLLWSLWWLPFETRYTVHCQAIDGQTPYRLEWELEGPTHDVVIIVNARRPPNAEQVCLRAGYIPYRTLH